MATRSVVGRTIGKEDIWIGKYVHWDGYPSHMVPTLIELVLRHNLNDVVSRLVFEHKGWSFINTEKPNWLKEEDDYVMGYGIPYTDQEMWITWEDEDAWGTEYAYIFDQESKSLHVLSRDYDNNKWDKVDIIDLGSAIYRVRNGESTIEEEITKSWQEQSVFAQLTH